MNDLSRTEPELLSPVAHQTNKTAVDLPHPLDGQWHINLQETTYGPYSGHHLKKFIADGRMVEATMVLPHGGGAWTKAKDDPILGSYFNSVPSPTLAHPPVSGRVNAGEGATVVQVTNNIVQPAPAAHVVIDGAAAPKSAGLALVLSILIAGLGQCYNGQIGKGIFMFLLGVMLWAVMLGWIVWIWSAIDAYQTAKAMNLRYMRLIGAGTLVVP